MFQVISCSIAVSSGNAGGSASATAAAGLPAPSDKPLDGMNLLSILRSETPAPRSQSILDLRQQRRLAR